MGFGKPVKDNLEAEAKQDLSIKDEVSNEPAQKRQRKKTKSRRRNKKTCNYCLDPFESVRSDAMYCSNSCKQSAYEKQGNINLYPCPAELFFMRLLRAVLFFMIQKERKKVDKAFFTENMFLLRMGETIFFDQIRNNSKVIQMYWDSVQPYMTKLEKQILNMKTNSYKYTLNGEFREVYYYLLDVLRGSDKEEW